MSSIRTLPRTSGIVAPVVAFGAILSATAVSPTFSWTLDALSELGRSGEPTAWLFNGGLVAGSLLALPFVRGVWLESEHPVGKAGSVVLAVAVGAMGLVGVFPVGHDLHFPVAVAFFAALTYALFLVGTGRALTGMARFGVTSIWLGIAHVTSWAVWSAGVRAGPGLAVPEAVGAVVFAAWMVLSVRRFP